MIFDSDSDNELFEGTQRYDYIGYFSQDNNRVVFRRRDRTDWHMDICIATVTSEWRGIIVNKESACELVFAGYVRWFFVLISDILLYINHVFCNEVLGAWALNKLSLSGLSVQRRCLLRQCHIPVVTRINKFTNTWWILFIMYFFAFL